MSENDEITDKITKMVAEAIVDILKKTPEEKQRSVLDEIMFSKEKDLIHGLQRSGKTFFGFSAASSINDDKK